MKYRSRRGIVSICPLLEHPQWHYYCPLPRRVIYQRLLRGAGVGVRLDVMSNHKAIYTHA